MVQYHLLTGLLSVAVAQVETIMPVAAGQEGIEHQPQKLQVGLEPVLNRFLIGLLEQPIPSLSDLEGLVHQTIQHIQQVHWEIKDIQVD